MPTPDKIIVNSLLLLLVCLMGQQFMTSWFLCSLISLSYVLDVVIKDRGGKAAPVNTTLEVKKEKKRGRKMGLGAI